MRRTPARRTLTLAVVAAVVAVTLSGCQFARLGARCRTTDWGDDGGRYVLACRNGRWVRALTKADAARFILATMPTTTTTPPQPSTPVTAPVTPTTVGVTAPSPTTTAPPGGVVAAVKVAVGGDHSCALLVNNTVRCWGLNSANQLGDGQSGGTLLSVRYVPVLVAGLTDAIDLASGFGFSCAVRAAGTVVCWGDNSSGQMGDGSTSTDLRSLVAVPGLTSVTSITASNASVCARRSDGSTRCWGQSGGDRYLTGTGTVSETSPVTLGLASGATVRLGDSHQCAVLADGTGRCWGSNSSGQLAQPVSVPNSGPVTIAGLGTVDEVVPAGLATCARASGTVRCWGGNGYGQLGQGTTDTDATLSPLTVPGLTGVTHLSSGGGDSLCATTSAGRVWCWGAASSPIPDNTGAPALSSVPVDMGVADVVNGSGSGSSACAVTGAGRVWCWGTDEYGQLGNDAPGSGSRSPVPVVGLG